MTAMITTDYFFDSFKMLVIPSSVANHSALALTAAATIHVFEEILTQVCLPVRPLPV